MKRLFYFLSILIILSFSFSGCTPKATSEKVIFISKPTNNSYVPGSGLVEISIGLLKEDAPVSKIEFYVDNTKIGEDFSKPYSFIWDTSYLKHGTSHIVEAKAIDSKGNILDRDSITCYINVEWTIIMYLDGHNDLANCIQTELNYIKSFSNTSGVNIVILVGPYQYIVTSYLYYYHNGTLDTIYSGSVNFGDPNNLSFIISYALNNFPAKKYLLVLKNHGSGWRSPQKENIDKDICFDHIYNDSLTIPEVREALFSSLSGKKIDLIYFDACVMGNIEVAYEIKDLAKYLIFSENVSYAPTRWDNILKILLLDPSCDAISLGKNIIDVYYNEYANRGITMSLIDLSKVDPILSELYYFATYLYNCLPNSAQGIMNLRYSTPSFNPYSNSNNEYIDLYYFALLVNQNTSYSDLMTSALNLMLKIEDAVIYNKYIGYPLLGGLSIWFPYIVDDWNEGLSKYIELQFFKNLGGYQWTNFLCYELYYYYGTSPSKLP